MNTARKHRLRKWFWWSLGAVGLVDHFLWPKLGIANSIPVLYFISIAANAIGESAAEEAAEGGG